MSRSPFSCEMLAPSQRSKYADLKKLYPTGELLLDEAEPVFVWEAPLGLIEYNFATAMLRYSLTGQPVKHHLPQGRSNPLCR